MSSETAGTSAADILNVDQLCKVYSNGKQALNSVSLSVPEGSFFALLGPNGAGKSTLINIMADTVVPTSGSIDFLGHDMFSERLWCKGNIGVVPQEVAFDPFFTPREVLSMVCGLYGQKPDMKWINDLLERLELARHANKNTRQLSGGMRRRLLVAQALVHRPRLVVLDEPTAGVDVELRKRLWDYMREINASGTTILLTTHYLEEAEELCDHVAIIDRGNVIASSSMKKLLHEVAGSYLWLRYRDGWVPGTADIEALSEFNPRMLEGQLCLTLSRMDLQQSTFHHAYESALQRFGPPLDAGVCQEDLEDVFLRLTREQII
ncbi:MAG: ABC transporter ATP-binding protein [Mariprofundaceae bacterium]|nr:ABC transporter ATP-binding protein [Mariprofundaceae bacterium]